MGVDDVLSEMGTEFDVTKLLAHGGAILQREIRNLMAESSKGKLGAASARDLVAYIKLLSELEAKQAADLANMTDDELEAAKRGSKA